MASLVISAAINIGVGLLLNHFFGPKAQDVEVEGSRLEDLSVSGSAYGRPRNKCYGTVRINGNIFWSPGIEEVVTSDKQEAGKGGGGGSTTTTTYTYFGTFALGFAEGVADRILRIWADNKLIFDATGTDSITNKFSFRFYKGLADQSIDPLIQADIDGKFGTGSTPAYNNTCYLVADRWPLQQFGNRIPNITAEIAFAGTSSLPLVGLTETPAHNIPGSFTGSDDDAATGIDLANNRLYFLKVFGNGCGVADVFSMKDINTIPTGGLENRSCFYTSDGFLYAQHSSSNVARFMMYEPVSGIEVHRFGVDSSVGSWPDSFNFPNGTWGGGIIFDFPGTPLPSLKILVFSFDGIFGAGGFGVYQQEVSDPTKIEVDTIDITPTGRGLSGGMVISNPLAKGSLGVDEPEIYWVQESATNIEFYKGKIRIEIEYITGQPVPVVFFEWDILVDDTKANVGLANADIRGSIVLPNENAIILSTGVPENGSMAKIDLETGATLASRQDFGSKAKNEVALYGRWSTCSDNVVSAVGKMFTIDTDTLETTAEVILAPLAFPSGEDSAVQSSASFDPRSDSVIFSRQKNNQFTAPTGARVVKMFMGKGSGFGEPLEDVVTDICLKAGFALADIDVTDLVGDEVRGYTISRSGSYRSALEPLQQAYLFEGAEIDWKLKFTKRGGAAALTIVEDDIGRLGDEEQIQEKRIQEVELPEKVIIEFADRDKDYEPVTAYDKRVASPSPTQYSRSEVKIQLPLVFTPTEGKRLASSALYTTWSERLSVDTSLPWRYLRLDPTDVVNMIFRGETRKLRMGEIEVGADLSLDFTAVQEDVSTFISTVVGTGGDGFLVQTPPSLLPTVWIPMNLPLLTADEASLQVSNTVYYAMSGYEDGWPGALLLNSLDSGVTYLQISAFNVECAYGHLRTVPTSIWDAVDSKNLAFSRKSGGEGGFTWDTTSEIDVVPLRGFDRWVSSTDTAVLNGANAFAILKRDGTVEICQFVTVTQPDISTIRVSRLLRGRRGTEDYANDGFFGGEMVVLLEQGKIMTWQSALNLVDITVPYKAVTAGTLIEDAPVIQHQSNGEDLRPYSVVNLVPGRDGSGNATIEWERRTRFNGELRDGIGVVPLNEEFELYDIEYYEADQALPFLTRTDHATKSDTLTTAEYEAGVGSAVNQLAFDNWNFEKAEATPPTDWKITGIGGGWHSRSAAAGSITGPPVGGGSNYALVWSTVSLTFSTIITDRWWDLEVDFNLLRAFLDSGPTITLDVWTTNPNDAAEGTEVQLRVYNASSGLIQTITTGRLLHTPGTWVNTVLTPALVSGARFIEPRLIGDNNSGPPLDDVTSAVDSVKVLLGASEVPPIDVKIYQKSSVVGRGKATRQRI